MNKLFELHFEWNTLILFLVFFVAIIFIGLIIIYVYNKPKKENNLEISETPVIGNFFPTRSLRREQAILATIILIILFIVFLVNIGSKIIYVYSNYNDDNYDTVVGEVYKFIAGDDNTNKVESFYIDDVKFEYSSGTYCGYNKTKNNGGIIIGDGQRLKIKYIPYKSENVIVYIEQLG